MDLSEKLLMFAERSLRDIYFNVRFDSTLSDELKEDMGIPSSIVD